MDASRALLVEAINSKRRISFVYNDKPRVVEPQCYGIGTKGTHLLRAHQLGGGAQREPLFEVSKMRELRLLDTFNKPGPHYKRDDSAMKVILAQL